MHVINKKKLRNLDPVTSLLFIACATISACNGEITDEAYDNPDDVGTPRSEETATIEQPITNTYIVKFIPEATANGGVYGTSVYRDSAAYSWMCNSGSPATTFDPADYIIQFHLQNAYANRDYLKLQGKNWWGSCYLTPSSGSRVYLDGDVRVCIGYFTVVLACGGSPPLTTDIVLGY